MPKKSPITVIFTHCNHAWVQMFRNLSTTGHVTFPCLRVNGRSLSVTHTQVEYRVHRRGGVVNPNRVKLGEHCLAELVWLKQDERKVNKDKLKKAYFPQPRWTGEHDQTKKQGNTSKESGVLTGLTQITQSPTWTLILKMKVRQAF